MAIRVEWVGYGREAAEALRREISQAKHADALAPVTVVVPSNHVGVAARRLLAAGTLGPACRHGVGLVGVSFVTPYRLAELLGSPGLAATGRKPVSTPVIAAALRASLAADAGLFAPVAEHPATETALVAAYRELREVAPRGLDAIAAKGARAADVVRLHRATRERLEPAWYDEQDLMRSAAAAIATDAGASTDLGTVAVYLPQRLSRHAHLLLHALADRCDVAVLAGVTGAARADADVIEAVRRLAPDAVAPPARDPNRVTDAIRTRIVLASDADDEVRVAVRRVIDAVRTGTPLDRIAVLHAGAEPYTRLAHEHLRAAGVQTNGPATMPLAGRMAGRVLLDLLALGTRDFRRQDVFAWLTTAPMLHHGKPLPVETWERISREAGVVAGRDDWDARLVRFAEMLEARAANPNPDLPESQPTSDTRNAERTRDLRRFVIRLMNELARVDAHPRGWAEHAQWARAQLATALGGPTRRDAWPDSEQKAAERVEAALNRLAALDPVEDAVGIEVFTRTLELELESDLGRVGRFGEGVFVGPVAMGIGLDLDLVVVLGLAEGTFPAPIHDDSLLPDNERAAAGRALPLRRARVDREHRELLAALAGAERHFLGVPRGDLRRSTERVPSRWILDFASALAGSRWWTDDLLHAQVEWVEHVASFDAGLRSLTFPATDQEHRLRSLLVAEPRNASALAALTDDRVLADNAELVASRRSSRFGRFDGNLAGLPVPSPIDATVSASRMETWAACPFAYFVQYVLGVRAVENPEATLKLRPIDHGQLVHQALERFILMVLDRPIAEQPGPDDAWSTADRAQLRTIGEALCDAFEAQGLTGRPIFWRRDRDRILRDLERFLDADDSRRLLEQTRPIAAELSFGFAGDRDESVPIALADGRALRFRGKADRVDRAADDSLRVLDYKTGNPDRYRGLSEDDPDQCGRSLQLTVYGAAARRHAHAPDAAVRSDYWFVSSKGRFKVAGYWITDAVLEKVGTTLTTMVGGIESGIFASHPTVVSSSPFVECPACDPDALGVTELRRAWERKRADPALSAYAQLAEPLADHSAHDDETAPVG